MQASTSALLRTVAVKKTRMLAIEESHQIPKIDRATLQAKTSEVSETSEVCRAAVRLTLGGRFSRLTDDPVRVGAIPRCSVARVFPAIAIAPEVVEPLRGVGDDFETALPSAFAEREVFAEVEVLAVIRHDHRLKKRIERWLSVPSLVAEC